MCLRAALATTSRARTHRTHTRCSRTCTCVKMWSVNLEGLARSTDHMCVAKRVAPISAMSLSEGETDSNRRTYGAETQWERHSRQIRGEVNI